MWAWISTAGSLASPLTAASYGGLACVGVHLMAGNSPDRAMFSGQRAVGYAAGLGWANHPFAEPGKDFGKYSAFTRPLWDMINSLASDPVRMFNPAVEDCGFARWSNRALYPIAYKDKAGNVLIMVTNLSDNTVSGKVEIEPAKLGVGPGSVLEWEEQDDQVVVRRAGRYTSDDIYQALFPQGAAKKGPADVKEGVREYVRKRHARR